jgi:hypothetical protein
MKRLLFIALFMCACAPLSPKAALRARAESELASCLGWDVGWLPSPSKRNVCLEESRSFCEANGLERTCGSAGLWTRDLSRSR